MTKSLLDSTYFSEEVPYGYTCIQCGQWVPSDMWHVCTPRSTLWADNRIVMALERIANALEKLADK